MIISTVLSRRRRRKRMAREGATTAPRSSETANRPVINLRTLAKGTVPAHGLVMAGSGFGRRRWGGNFFPWLKRLLGACAVASAIAMGLFVYTEFVAAWKNRGLPTIPITALNAIGEAGQTGVPPGAHSVRQPVNHSRQQKLDILNTYVG